MAGFSPGMIKGPGGKGVLGKGFEGLNDCWKSKGKGKGLDKIKPPDPEDDRTCARMPKRGEIMLPAPPGPSGFLKPPGCATCGNFGAHVVCGRCKVNLYCDDICQRRHWPEHKQSCQPPDEVLRKIVEDPRVLERGYRRRRRAEKHEAQGLADFFARGGKKAQARARSRSRSVSSDGSAASDEGPALAERPEDLNVDDKRPAWLRRKVKEKAEAKEAAKSGPSGPRPREGKAPRAPPASQQPSMKKGPVMKGSPSSLAETLDNFCDEDTDASDGASSTAGSESGGESLGSFGRDTDEEIEVPKDAARLDMERQGREVGEFLNGLPPIVPSKEPPRPTPEAAFYGIKHRPNGFEDENQSLPAASMPWKTGGGVVSLSNGVDMPRIVLGTAGKEGLSGKSGRAAIYAAIRLGYRCIDTSEMNQNLMDVAWAYLKADVPRKELFFIAKIAPWSYGYQKTMRSFQKQLHELRLDYVDLLLLQWPHVWDPSQTDWGMAQWRKSSNWTHVQRKGSWRALEELYQSGKVRAIGVSNFTVDQLERVVRMGQVKPHVMQSESHPHWTTKGVRNWCREQGVAFQGYAPLGGQKTEHNNGHRPIDDEVVKSVADRYDVTPAQVLIYWNLSRNESTVVKAKAFRHLRENLDLSRLQLRGQDLSRIDALGPEMRVYGPVYWGHSDVDKCHPWINEEMLMAEQAMDPKTHPMSMGQKTVTKPGEDKKKAWEPQPPAGAADPLLEEMEKEGREQAQKRPPRADSAGLADRRVSFAAGAEGSEPLVEYEPGAPGSSQVEEFD